MAERRITKAQVRTRLVGLDQEAQKAVLCALVGHSKIVHSCIGQITCGRCGAIIGDTLAGVYNMSDKVIIGHNCRTCRENYKQLTWRDKFMAPDPFSDVRAPVRAPKED